MTLAVALVRLFKHVLELSGALPFSSSSLPTPILLYLVYLLLVLLHILPKRESKEEGRKRSTLERTFSIEMHRLSAALRCLSSAYET